MVTEQGKYGVKAIRKIRFKALKLSYFIKNQENSLSQPSENVNFFNNYAKSAPKPNHSSMVQITTLASTPARFRTGQLGAHHGLSF